MLSQVKFDPGRMEGKKKHSQERCKTIMREEVAQTDWHLGVVKTRLRKTGIHIYT